MKKLFFAFALCGFASAHAATPAPYADDFDSYNPGENVTFANWSSNGKVDIFGTSSTHGNYAGLDGRNGSSKDLWQDFDLDKGVTYILSFDLKLSDTSNCDCAEVGVKFGQSTGTFDALIDGWNTYSLSFTAGKTKSFRVRFTNGSGNEVLLDNVKITSAVPEPETYAMLLAGLGMVGMIARRRKQA